MKVVEAQEQLMIKRIIEKLHELNYYDTEGKSKRELVAVLAKLRAMEVDVGNPGNGWF